MQDRRVARGSSNNMTRKRPPGSAAPHSQPSVRASTRVCSCTPMECRSTQVASSGGAVANRRVSCVAARPLASISTRAVATIISPPTVIVTRQAPASPSTDRSRDGASAKPPRSLNSESIAESKAPLSTNKAPAPSPWSNSGSRLFHAISAGAAGWHGTASRMWCAPSKSRMFATPGVNASPICARGRVMRSTTPTRYPSCCNRSAHVSPAGPAPLTSTSSSSVDAGIEFVEGSGSRPVRR